MIRFFQIPPHESRRPKRCHDLDCSEPTSGGKDYCTAHVLRQAYAAEVEATVAESDREILEVAALEATGQDGSAAVDVSGVVAQDIVQLVGRGPVSLAGARRAVLCGKPMDVVRAYVRALEAAGLVRTRVTYRGRRTVRVEAI